MAKSEDGFTFTKATDRHQDRQEKNVDLMVLLQGTRAVLRPLLDFVKLFAESQAKEDLQVRADGSCLCGTSTCKFSA